MAHLALPEDPPRCYRCLTCYPIGALKPVAALCGCEHDYCEDCIRDERLGGWLRFVGERCTKSARAA
jgi:hypothetical protein